MKQLLLELLDTREPSRATTNNCINLINREDHCPPHSPRTHEELLARARDKALDTAQELERALQTTRLSHLDHCDLMGYINRELQHIDRDLQSGAYKDCHPGLTLMRTRLRSLLVDHDTARQQRALRRV